MTGAAQPGEGGLLVHEWIESSGGAEKVLDALHALVPAAEIFCLWDDAPDRFPGTKVTQSWVARSPLRDRKAAALLVMSSAMRRAPLADKDWALVSSHSFAHHLGVRHGRRRVPTFVYAHTPPRYLWAPEVDPRSGGAAVRALGPSLRRLDRRMASSPGATYAVNSGYVAARARRAWGLDARVIHPPVDVHHVGSVLADPLHEMESDQLDMLPADFVLGVSRFVPYKRLDLVIELAEEVGLPAVICGSGPEEALLRERARSASVPVHVVIRPTDAVLFQLMASAVAFVFPPVEDFGIVPVEALAAGACVIVNSEGGAGEIVDALGGGATHDFRRGGARDALGRALSATRPDPALIDRVLGVSRFQREIQSWMRDGGVVLPSVGREDPAVQ